MFSKEYFFLITQGSFQIRKKIFSKFLIGDDNNDNDDSHANNYNNDNNYNNNSDIDDDKSDVGGTPPSENESLSLKVFVRLGNKIFVARVVAP